MFDLAISQHGDLVMGANRDLAGVSGTDLVNQRIILRLIVKRGTWFYDTDGTLGSNLHQTIGASPDSALNVDAYVREALRSMTEIQIEDIAHRYDSELKSVVIKIDYTIVENPDEQDIDTPGGDTQMSTVTIPFPMGGE